MNINGLEITDTVVFPIKTLGGNTSKYLRAFARVVFNDNLIVQGIRLFEGVNGYYITFPEPTDTFPITAELRVYIFEAIRDEYLKTKTGV